VKPGIELNIDQLILEGFSRKEAYSISQSLKSELHRLIEKDRLENKFMQDHHQPTMTVNPIAAKPNTNSKNVGRQIAQSIFNGLSGNTVNNK
jgi:hypothetical protein